MANMAWAENAVIIKDDGSRVSHHPKCPACGTVDVMRTSSAHVCSVTNAGSCFCPKGGKSFSCKFGR